MSFKIIVDSCCDLSPELLRSGIFHSVPLTIYVGENEFRDDDTLVPQTLVDAMAMCQDASHTACPSPADYLDCSALRLPQQRMAGRPDVCGGAPRAQHPGI